MYRVVIINGIDKITVNEPTANKDAPRIMSGVYHPVLSQPDSFEFVLPIMNPGWGNIKGLNTKVKVINIEDNSILFTGRVLPYKDEQTDNGIFDGDYTCEGSLAYLNDTLTRRWNYTNQTPEQILTDLLSKHNEKMDTSRQIQLGIVEITTAITIDTNFETTLNAILTKLRNILGGDIRVQERNEILYLDYLKAQGTDNGVKIELDQNQSSISRQYDPSDVITRLIGHGYGEGINQLDITSENNGSEYVENSDAINEYGIIEGLYTNSEIQNAFTLLQATKTALEQNKQPAVVIDTSMVDRSVLAEYNFERFELGDTLNLLNNVLKLDVSARVTEIQFDILTPWDKDIVISTRSITLTEQIIDLKQRTTSIENAPQGNTCLFALTKAENADATHPITFDLDVPPEAININKVYINLHGRKYRAYERGATSEDIIATSGASSKTTSDDGGSNTPTSSSGGNHRHMMFDVSPTQIEDKDTLTGTFIASSDGNADNTAVALMANLAVDDFSNNKPLYTNTSSGNHSHTVEIPKHNHGMEHTHKITIPKQELSIEYGIYEGEYPKNVKVSVNGTDAGVKYGDGTTGIDEYNIDITSRINAGNNKIEITTDQNGRIEAIVYAQIFIQSK